MHVRGINAATDFLLEFYQAEPGPVQNRGFWEIECAARPLPNPPVWRAASRQMGDLNATYERARADFSIS